jgi:hypothetical protein
MTQWRLVLALVLTVVVAASGTVSAEAKPKPKAFVTVSLAAVVEEVSDPFQLVCSDVAVGDTITATYTYNRRTPDTDPNDNTGAYVHVARPSGFRVDLGDAIVRTDKTLFEFQVLLIDNTAFGSDTYQVVSNGALVPTPCGVTSGLILFQLDDPTHTALNGVTLPTTAPNLADFTGNRLEIYGVDGNNNFYIRAHVTSTSLCDKKKPKKC